MRRGHSPVFATWLSFGLVGSAVSCFVQLDGPPLPDAGNVADVAEASTVDVAAGDAGCNGGQGVVRVQAAHANTLTGTSDKISVTLDAEQNAGDFLVVGVNYVACPGVQQVADSVGNGYQRFVPAETLGDAGSLETWGAPNVMAAGAGANTVTVSFGDLCPRMNMKVVEYRGVDPVSPVDTTASAHGTGGAPTATVTIPSGELLFAHTADSLVAVGPGMGWTEIFEDEWMTIAEEQAATSAGSYPVTFQPSSGEDWVIQAVALRCR